MSYYLDIAITKLEQFGIKLEGIIDDQEGWKLGGDVIYPNKRRGILLAGKTGYLIKNIGYTKSIDVLMCLKAKREFKDLLIYIHDIDTFYSLLPSMVIDYAKSYKINNLQFSILIVNEGLCPICGGDLVHKELDSCAFPSHSSRYECYRHRLKFHAIPLVHCGAKNLNVTKTIPQSEGELYLDALFMENNLNLLYTGNKEMRGLDRIYGCYPDWIAPRYNKLVEYDSHKRTDPHSIERDLKIAEHKCAIFKIEENWVVYKNNHYKRQKLIHDLRLFLGFDKMRLEGW